MAGTKATGYMPPVKGGFCCANCRFYRAKGLCGNPQVMKDPQMNRTNGFADVKKHGCCNEFEPGEAK